MKLLNFAYGSNMLVKRLRERVPSARPVTTAILRGRELRWHKLGMDGSGKCDIVCADRLDALVHGVVYELHVDEKASLDAAEGLGHGYEQVALEVESAGNRISVFAYQALMTDPGAMPFDWYKALVVAGARENRLPADYVARLEATRVARDPDDRRSARHYALVGVDRRGG